MQEDLNIVAKYYKGTFSLLNLFKRAVGILCQVPKCGQVPYQKCEEGYEDKCKETPKKVINTTMRTSARKPLKR